MRLVAGAVSEPARLASLVGSAALVAVLPIILAGLTVMEAGADRGKPYIDELGKGRPITVCDGVVVKVWRRYSEAECDALVEGLVVGYYGPAVIRCVPALGMRERGNQLIASVWFAWNLGPDVFCRSSGAKAFLVGQWRQGCHLLTRYIYSRGVKRQGLINRRGFEERRCLQGL